MGKKVKITFIIILIIGGIGAGILLFSKDKEIMKDYENERLQNIIDSLDNVNEGLREIISQKQKEEEEAFEKFKRETEKMKENYEKKIHDIEHLDADGAIEFLSRELSSED